MKAATRKAIPRSAFALPGGTTATSRPAYPVDTKKRARAAKSYAATQVKRGTITPGQEATIDRRADARLAKGRGKKGLLGL